MPQAPGGGQAGAADGPDARQETTRRRVTRAVQDGLRCRPRRARSWVCSTEDLGSCRQRLVPAPGWALAKLGVVLGVEVSLAPAFLAAVTLDRDVTLGYEHGDPARPECVRLRGGDEPKVRRAAEADPRSVRTATSSPARHPTSRRQPVSTLGRRRSPTPRGSSDGKGTVRPRAGESCVLQLAPRSCMRGARRSPSTIPVPFRRGRVRAPSQ